MPDADFLVFECGNGTCLTPLSEKARNACQDRIGVEPWNWMFGSVVVDDRIASDLITNLKAGGFTFERRADLRPWASAN